MLPHELGYAKVEYYDRKAEKDREIMIYFRYLPRKGDMLTVYQSDNSATIRGRVGSIEHFVEDQRRVEPDITIRLEAL